MGKRHSIYICGMEEWWLFYEMKRNTAEIDGHSRKILFYMDASFQTETDEIIFSKYLPPSSNPTWSGILSLNLST